ncbi:UNVERIFIED_CONTAM: hypothetical protein MT382_18660 [Aeromonas salmonicida]
MSNSGCKDYLSVKDICSLIETGETTEEMTGLQGDEAFDCEPKASPSISGDERIYDDKVKGIDPFSKISKPSVEFNAKIPLYNARQMSLIRRLFPKPIRYGRFSDKDMNDNSEYILSLFNSVKNNNGVKLDFLDAIYKWLGYRVSHNLTLPGYIEVLNKTCTRYLIEKNEVFDFVDGDKRKADFVWAFLVSINLNRITQNPTKKEVVSFFDDMKKFDVKFKNLGATKNLVAESALHLDSDTSSIKNSSASSEEICMHILEQFDILNLTIDEKKTVLAAIKIKWDIAVQDKRMVKWVGSNQTIVEWTWEYIVLHFFNKKSPPWVIDLGAKYYNDLIITTFDMLDGNEKELMIEKIRKYGSAYKSRRKLKNSPATYYLSDDAKLKLELLSENLRKNKSETIEYLIAKEYSE